MIPSWKLAQGLFFFISLLGLVWIARFSSARFLAVLFLTRYVMINLEYGQINILILVAMVLVHDAAVVGLSARAGLLLGLAGGLKIFPLVQGLSFLRLRRWKAVLWTGAGVGFFLVLPYLVWDKDLAHFVYQGFFSELKEKGIPLYSHNQSWVAILSRFLGGESFDLFSIGKVNWSIASLPAFRIQNLAWFIGGALSIWVWRVAFKREKGLDLLSAACFSILFLSHIVWKPYYLFLFPALVTVLESKPWRDPLFYVFLGMGPLISPDMIGYRNSAVWDAAGGQMLGAVLLAFLWSRAGQKKTKRRRA